MEEDGTPTEETESETIDGSGTVTNTPTGGDVTIDATGDHIITTAKYTENPGGAATFSATGDYYDVHLDDDAGVNSLTIIYYWDGASWGRASDQRYDAALGCVVVTITDSTQPNLADLTGLPFASGKPYTYSVGGQAYPVNKLGILAPWIGLIAAIVAGATVAIRRRRA